MADNKIKNKAGDIKGIIDGFNNNDEESEGNKSSKEEKSKGIKEDKNKSSKEGKKKRSFMLKNSQIEKIYLLKAKNSDMTMSEIVGQAIDEFYESESEN